MDEPSSFLNILLLTYQGDVAGSTYSMSYLVKGLAAKGHRVAVGCRQGSLLYKLLEGSEAIVCPMTFGGRFDTSNWKQIHTAVKRYAIQVINPQSSMDRYTVAFAKWRYRLPVKVVHTRRQMPASSGGWPQALFYMCATDKIVAVSQAVKEGLVAMGVRPSHIRVIYNGTPASKYDQADPSQTERLRKQYGLKSLIPVVGCVARMKRQNQILQAATRLPEPLTLLFVGIEKNHLDPDLLSKLSDDKPVICTGTVTAESALAHYGLFDSFVLPSVTEGLSQSILEAMTLGIPVIATKAGGNGELIRDGVDGYLFDDGDTDKLADLVELVHHDKAVREGLIANGRRRALEDFSIKNTVNQFEQLFSSLCNPIDGCDIEQEYISQ